MTGEPGAWTRPTSAPPRSTPPRAVFEGAPPASPPTAPVGDLAEAAWLRTCFYSSPIGEPGSPERRHADAFMGSLVEPAVRQLDPSMRVVRADQLATSLISAGILDHVAQSRLLIADLSFHNPNVLNEVGRRQERGMAYVLITRAEDQIPSNLRDVRTVQVSTEIGTFLGEMDSYRDLIAKYARCALGLPGG